MPVGWEDQEEPWFYGIHCRQTGEIVPPRPQLPSLQILRHQVHWHCNPTAIRGVLQSPQKPQHEFDSHQSQRRDKDNDPGQYVLYRQRGVLAGQGPVLFSRQQGDAGAAGGEAHPTTEGWECIRLNCFNLWSFMHTNNGICYIQCHVGGSRLTWCASGSRCPWAAWGCPWRRT